MTCYTKNKMRATASCLIPAVSRSLFALFSALFMLHCVTVTPTCASFLQEQQASTAAAAAATTTTTTTSLGRSPAGVIAEENIFVYVAENSAAAAAAEGENETNSDRFQSLVEGISSLLNEQQTLKHTSDLQEETITTITTIPTTAPLPTTTTTTTIIITTKNEDGNKNNGDETEQGLFQSVLRYFQSNKNSDSTESMSNQADDQDDDTASNHHDDDDDDDGTSNASSLETFLDALSEHNEVADSSLSLSLSSRLPTETTTPTTATPKKATVTTTKIETVKNNLVRTTTTTTVTTSTEESKDFLPSKNNNEAQQDAQKQSVETTTTTTTTTTVIRPVTPSLSSLNSTSDSDHVAAPAAAAVEGVSSSSSLSSNSDSSSSFLSSNSDSSSSFLSSNSDSSAASDDSSLTSSSSSFELKALDVGVRAEGDDEADPQDDPRFDWDTEMPYGFFICGFTGFPVTADNGVILRFAGAAMTMSAAGVPFKAMVECGKITDETECSAHILSGTEDDVSVCEWTTNDLELGAKYGTASCSGVPSNAFSSLGLEAWFSALERYEAMGYLNVSEDLIFMREHELFECMQYTDQGADVCNSQTDSRGHPCSMCEQIPAAYYGFIDPPVDPTDSNYIRLCLADYTYPTMCRMFKQVTTMCADGSWWEPTYDSTTEGPADSSSSSTATTTTTTTATTTTTTTVKPEEASAQTDSAGWFRASPSSIGGAAATAAAAVLSTTILF